MLMDESKCVTETMTVNPTNVTFLQTYKDCLSGKVCPELSMRDRKYICYTWVKSCVNMSRLHYFLINKIKHIVGPSEFFAL